ncbi:hypothetical protein HHK36_026324 [Tetracentron sinense]|uniref:Uncharacterized protein n=1 Tax=Tetracentron sinense TaxID=13715 RepID=A0A834YGM7_TETSI|nr:hypothetical protein HHK36_026324 [Tetracentron sinense]
MVSSRIRWTKLLSSDDCVSSCSLKGFCVDFDPKDEEDPFSLFGRDRLYFYRDSVLSFVNLFVFSVAFEERELGRVKEKESIFDRKF